jgi:hypothetical protein
VSSLPIGPINDITYNPITSKELNDIIKSNEDNKIEHAIYYITSHLYMQ